MIRAIIVDDEQMARDTIELFLQKYYPSIKLTGKAKSVDVAVKLFRNEPPDIVFLDINMPEKNGFVLFDEIDLGNTKVIFTTAYSEFAIKALNMSASYYLLKPISPTEFQLAVEKSIEKIKQQSLEQPNIEYLRDMLKGNESYSEKIIINAKNGYEIIETKNILYLVGDKNYTWIYELENKHLVAKTLKEYEDFLDPNLFFRSHQSHLVNKRFVKKVLNNRPDQIELKNGILLNLSRDKKKLFLEWIAK